MDNEYKKVFELIKSCNSIYITSHKSPDGDAMGSMFALYLVLKNMGKDVHVIMQGCSDRFKFLNEVECAEKSINASEYDLCILVDLASQDRSMMSEEDYTKANNYLIIDHHLTTKINDDILSLVDSKAPATCELIYRFLLSQNITIDEDIAKYLYMGILTDTGSFNYSNTTAETHRIVADLIEYNFDFAYVCRMVNDTMKEERLKLIAYTINNIETFANGKIKYVCIDQDVIEKFNVTDEDADGLVNYLRCIENVDVAIYVREQKDGTYKVSMRSNGNVDISKAATRFGGGGHKNAAGFTVNEKIDNVKNEIIKVVGECL